MSYRRPRLRRALAPSLALAVGLAARRPRAARRERGHRSRRASTVALADPADAARLRRRPPARRQRSAARTRVARRRRHRAARRPGHARRAGTATHTGGLASLARPPHLRDVGRRRRRRPTRRPGGCVVAPRRDDPARRRRARRHARGASTSPVRTCASAAASTTCAAVRARSTRCRSTTTTSALYGSRLVWSEADGTVRLRDVATFAAPTVAARGHRRRARRARTQVAINGDDASPTASPAAGSACGTSARASVGRTRCSLAGVERFRLGDGFLVTTRPHGVTLLPPQRPADASVRRRRTCPAFTSSTSPSTVTRSRTCAPTERRRSRSCPTRSTASAARPCSRDRCRRVLARTATSVADAWTPVVRADPAGDDVAAAGRRPATNAPVATFASAVGAPPTANVAVVRGRRAADARRARTRGRSPATGRRRRASTRRAAPRSRASSSLRRTQHRTSRDRRSGERRDGQRARRARRCRGGRPARSRRVCAPASYDVAVPHRAHQQGQARRTARPGRVADAHDEARRRRSRARGCDVPVPRAQQGHRRPRRSVVGVGDVEHAARRPRRSALRYSKGWKSKRARRPWAGTHHCDDEVEAHGAVDAVARRAASPS